MEPGKWIASRPRSTCITGSGLPIEDAARSRARRVTLGKLGCFLDEPLLDVAEKVRVVHVNVSMLQSRWGLACGCDRELMELLGLLRRKRDRDASGPLARRVPSEPFAWCYAGFQFGVMAGQLGDGRSATVLEAGDSPDTYCELQLKGGLTTPYSRGLDGKLTRKAAVKEYLLLAHLQALSVPAADPVAIAFSSTMATREGASELTGVLCRAMRSGARVGTLEALFYTRNPDVLASFMSFWLATFRPHIAGLPAAKPGIRGGRWHAALCDIAGAIGRLVADWLAVGFVHGTMNTDNMSLHGETIDIGASCFTAYWDAAYTLNSDDVQGVYAFGKQQEAGRKVVEHLALALSPLFEPSSPDGGAVDPKDLAAAKLALGDGTVAYDGAFEVQLRRRIRQRMGVPSSGTTFDTLADLAIAALAEVGSHQRNEEKTSRLQAWSIADFFSSVAYRRRCPEPIADCPATGRFEALWQSSGASKLVPAGTGTTPQLVLENESVQAMAAYASNEEIAPAEAASRVSKLFGVVSGAGVFHRDADRAAFIDRLIADAPPDDLDECGCG